MVTERWPHIMAAIRRRESHEAKDLWELGGALAKEADENTLGSLAKYIETQGFEGYSESWLKVVLWTWRKFPANARVPGISFRTHTAAGSPYILQAIIKMSGKKFVSLHYVERHKAEVEKVLRRREEIERKAEVRKAKVRVAHAYEVERAAKKRQQQAQSLQERRSADRELAEAKLKRREAEVDRQVARKAPSPRGLPEVRKPAHSVLVSKAVANAKRAKLLTSQTLQMLEGKSPNFTEVELNAIVENWIAVQQAATAILNVVRKRQFGRGHLAAVEEEVA